MTDTTSKAVPAAITAALRAVHAAGKAYPKFKAALVTLEATTQDRYLIADAALREACPTKDKPILRVYLQRFRQEHNLKAPNARKGGRVKGEAQRNSEPEPSRVAEDQIEAAWRILEAAYPKLDAKTRKVWGQRFAKMTAA